MVLAVIVGIGTGLSRSSRRPTPAASRRRASAVRRAGRPRHAGPRHLRPASPPAWSPARPSSAGRRRRDWPGRRGYGDGRRRRSWPGRQGGDGCGFRHCRRRARWGGNAAARPPPTALLQPAGPARRRRGRTRRGRASGRFSRSGSCAARRRSTGSSMRESFAAAAGPVSLQPAIIDRRDGRRHSPSTPARPPADRRVPARRPGQRMKAQPVDRPRTQTAAQVLRSGDSHGGGHSVDLSGGE